MSPDDLDPQGPQKPFDPVKADAEAKAILAQGGSQHDVDTYLQQTYGLRAVSPASAGPQNIHQQYASGALQRRMAAENAAETAPEAPSGFQAGVRSLRSGIETLGSNLPFVGPLVNRANAGVRSLGERIPYREALRRENEDIAGYQAENPRASLGLNVAGSALIPFGKVIAATRAGGALLGGGAAAAQRFGQTTNPDESLSDRLKGTAIQGGIGAAAGAIAPTILGSPTGRAIVGGGLGAFLAPEGARIPGAVAGATLAANPSGTANVLSNLAGRVGATGAQTRLADLANAMGTRGFVNREVEGIQRIARPLGTSVGAQAPGAAQTIAQAQQFEAQSQALYDAARNSPKVLNDPKTLQLISDPDLAKGFAIVDDIRAAAGKSLPQQVIGQRQVASSLLQPNGQPFTYTQPVTGSVPDPEALHLLKRIIRDRVERGFNSESPIPIEEALKLQPKVEALTNHLHNVSQEFQDADRFFQLGQTAQEAAQLGYGAAKAGMRNPSAAALGTKDVAGARNFVATQGHADPVQDAALRQIAASQVQQGARNELAQQVAAQGLAGGRAGVLNAPGLAMSGPAAAQRALALGSQAPEFENTLTKVRGEVAAQQKPSLTGRAVAIATRGHVLPVANNAGEQALQSPLGQRMLSRMVQNPQQAQAAIASYLRGSQDVGTLQLLAALAASRMAASQ